MFLKENIIEHFDYEAVSPDVWKHLYSWYSTDWCIMRYIKKDRVNRYALVLDLYPEKKSMQIDDGADVDGQPESESDSVVDLIEVRELDGQIMVS